MRKIKLYGRLRKFVGVAVLEAEVKSPFEALSFLHCNFKGIEKHMALQPYTIICGETTITEDLINLETEEDINIIPLAHGNFFTFIIGAAIKWGAKNYIKNTILSTIVSTIGTQLLVTGINNMLTPQRSNNVSSSQMDRADPAAFAANYSFTGLTNVSQAGVPVNLVYGEILVGSITVSNGIDTGQVEGNN